MFKYDLSIVPLGFLELNKESNVYDFPVHVVARLSFSGRVSVQDKIAAVNAHPLIGLVTEAPKIRITTNNQSFSVSLTEKNSLSSNRQADFLGYLLGKPESLLKKEEYGIEKSVKELKHTPVYDSLQASDIVDNSYIHDHLIKAKSAYALFYSREYNSSDALQVGTSEDVLSELDLRNSRHINSFASQFALEGLHNSNEAVEDLAFEALSQDSATISSYRSQFGDLFAKVSKAKQVTPDIKMSWKAFEDRILGRVNDQGLKARLESIERDEGIVGEEELAQSINERDPNILIQSALKEPLVARRFGLVTSWTVSLTLDQARLVSMNSPCELELHNDGAEKFDHFPTVSKFDVLSELNGDFFAHVSPCPAPKSLKKIGFETYHNGLVWLNDKLGNERFKTEQVNVEHELSKGVGLQISNSVDTQTDLVKDEDRECFNNLDHYSPPKQIETEQAREGGFVIPESGKVKENRELNQEKIKENNGLPKELNETARHGLNQPTTSGVSFMAPIEDMIASNCGANCSGSDKKYYLEDLWVGYRVDIRNTVSDQNPFLSLHEQNVNLKDKGVSVLDKKGYLHIAGKSESYLEREHLQSCRAPSTEFGLWTGIGGAQVNPIAPKNSLFTDKRKKYNLDEQGNQVPVEDLSIKYSNFEKVKSSVFGSLPRLAYKNKYQYRLRTVFACGISLDKEQANKLTSSIDNRTEYEQEFNFHQTESYSPGEIVPSEKITDGNGQDPSNEHTVYLLEGDRLKELYLVPRPLNFQECRFRNILGKSKDEKTVYRKTALTNDVRNYLLSSEKFRWKPYFLDPEVDSVVIRGKSLTTNSEAVPTFGKIRVPESTEGVEEGTMCRLQPHWRFDSKVLDYGRNANWEKFQPICIRVQASKNTYPSTSVRNRRRLPSIYNLKVPPGDIVELSILPNINPDQLEKTAIYGSALKWAKQRKMNLQFLRSRLSPILPIISEQKISFINAPKKPREAPLFLFSKKYLVREAQKSNGLDELYSLARLPNGNSGYLVGDMTIDSKTTGTVRFETTWVDPIDNVNQPNVIYRESSYTTPSRTVLFTRKPLPEDKLISTLLDTGRKEVDAAKKNGETGDLYRPLKAHLAEMMDHQESQCMEDNLHFLSPKRKEVDPTKANHQQNLTAEIRFPDGKRRIVNIKAIAEGRYKELYPESVDSDFRKSSKEFQADLPSILKPSTPAISHILPTFKDNKVERDGKTVSSTEMGLRIYLDRSWFETGVGERLAIGCAVKKNDSAEEYARIKKYATMWGEDPLQRPKLDQTKSLPKAQDFAAPEDTGEQEILDSLLYPESGEMERSNVLYSDVLHPVEEKHVEVLKTNKQGQEKKQTVSLNHVIPINLASFAVRFDSEQSLWYCDVIVKGSFFGWLGMSLYRHQPHSVDDKYSLSEEPIFAYMAILEEYPIVAFVKDGYVNIEVGPIFDKEIEFSLVIKEKLAKNIYQSQEIVEKHPLTKIKLSSGGIRCFISAKESSAKNIFLEKYKSGALVSSIRVVV